MERRLAAILAADVEGYSRHTELNEEASTATLRMHRAVVEEAISAHRGHIFSSAGESISTQNFVPALLSPARELRIFSRRLISSAKSWLKAESD